MVVTDFPPDQDSIMQFASQLDIVCNFLFTNMDYTARQLCTWQQYLFEFEHTLSQAFDTDVSTKILRPMHQIHDHSSILRSFLRSFSKENDQLQMQFKNAYSSTRDHVKSIAPHLFK